MKLLKWVLIFVFAFVVAWILIFTFTQPPFAEGVPAKIFTYRTPPIPVYIYVAGAFITGLFMGCLLAFYNYLTGSMKAHKLSKRLNAAESELAVLKVSTENHNTSTPKEMPGKVDDPDDYRKEQPNE
ncbi:MAG TPA: LapA family protein [Chitinispirillaceae bacterium]|nr:LapA family protein [Chitinispirillaceae bacterium]